MEWACLKIEFLAFNQAGQPDIYSNRVVTYEPVNMVNITKVMLTVLLEIPNKSEAILAISPLAQWQKSQLLNIFYISALMSIQSMYTKNRNYSKNGSKNRTK